MANKLFEMLMIPSKYITHVALYSLLQVGDRFLSVHNNNNNNNEKLTFYISLCYLFSKSWVTKTSKSATRPVPFIRTTGSFFFSVRMTFSRPPRLPPSKMVTKGTVIPSSVRKRLRNLDRWSDDDKHLGRQTDGRTDGRTSRTTYSQTCRQAKLLNSRLYIDLNLRTTYPHDCL